MKGTEDGIRTKTKGLEMFVKNQSRENKSAVEDRKRQCKGLRLLKQHLAGKRLIRSEAIEDVR